jgi:hypothetical protein
VFFARDGPIRECVDDGSVGAIDISRFRCSGLPLGMTLFGNVSMMDP